MYISTVIFVALYLLSAVAGYCIADVTGALIVAAALPIGIFIQMKLAIYQADATKLEYLSPSDRNRLALAFENVLQRCENYGYTFSKNPEIYLSEDESLNAFSCGNAIVINRGLLNSGCLEAVIAHEVKHWKFNDSYASCLICNIITILSLLAMFVLNMYVFAATLIIGIIAASLGNGTIGVFVGTLSGRFLYKIKDLFLRATFFLMNAVQCLLMRHTEYQADKFAVLVGYGEQMKQFLRLTYESRTMMSLSARLLSSHPSDSKRIGNIQRIQNQLNENNHTPNLPFRV